MKTLFIKSHAKQISEIKIDLAQRPLPKIRKGECLIKVSSSGINPSDALSVMGYFKEARLPRIPGRDFSGIVIDGSQNWIGKFVWGTGGAAGISSDGTNAEYIKLTENEIAEVPNNLDLLVAGAQPLPYVTAYYSLAKRAKINEGDTVLVVGALGQVGRAAMSICHWKKCSAIALVRGKSETQKAQELGWKAINSEDENLHEKILEVNNGKSIQVILNSVGNFYWKEFLSILADFGRIVTISARENTREASINLFDLYRSNQDIIGVNTVPFDFSQNAVWLNELKRGFEESQLIPLTLEKSKIYSMESATKAYQEVLNGSRDRVILKFNEV